MNTAAPPLPDDDADVAGLLPPGTQELSIADALQLALRMHRENRLEGARTLYQRVLEAVPEHPDALCMLGVAEHQMGRSEHGLKLMRRAIDRVPDFVGFHVNMGNVLAELSRLPDALKAFQKAAELAPGVADVHNNLGAVHRVMGQLEQARASFDRALAIDPRHARAWNNIGLLHDRQGDLDAAVAAYLKVIDLTPNQGLSAHRLGMVYDKMGDRPRAISVFRQWMEREPNNPVPAHLYASCSGLGVPDRASDAYVKAEFDSFAASFESMLNERLHYRAPQLCVDLLSRCLSAPQSALDVLDAGCGTGLCGPLLAPWARQLVGVDLSGGMLYKARSKGVYHQLVQAELTAYLQQGPECWDAINCADTLCYFGDLVAVMGAAATALRPGATLVFTVEALADDNADEAPLLPSGRYAHGRAHIERALAQAGLRLAHANRDVLRHDAGAPLEGWVVAAQRPH